MPRAGAVLEEQEPIVAAAVVAAQATLGDPGFRQRDVRFFIELFSNWLQSTTGSYVLAIHNVQVQRYLDTLCSARGARRTGRKPPRYQLSPEGVVELLRRMRTRRNLTRLDEFFLVFHIFDTYGTRLRSIIEREGRSVSRALALDVDELLDKKQLVAAERAAVARELRRLQIRIEESRATSALTRKLLDNGQPLTEVIEAVERQFPYELNSQKPLGELLQLLPLPWRRAELETAAAERATTLWHPTHELLLAYDKILQELERR
jgi:hypothetical protein